MVKTANYRYNTSANTCKLYPHKCLSITYHPLASIVKFYSGLRIFIWVEDNKMDTNHTPFLLQVVSFRDHVVLLYSWCLLMIFPVLCQTLCYIHVHRWYEDLLFCEECAAPQNDLNLLYECSIYLQSKYITSTGC